MSPLSVRASRSIHALESGQAKLWVLLVGVNQYQDAQLPALQYSAIDCQGLSEALAEATQAFPEKEVRVHHDFAAELPQLEAVRASLKQMVVAAQPQDTVLIYFSGHGVLDARKQQAFLCLADTDKANLVDTGLGMAELLHLLGNCAARQQLIWLDACHSGGMTLLGREGGAKAAWDMEPLPNPTNQLVDVLRQRATQSQGFYALLSCDRAQQSWEFPELGHGVFTYYLMRGLRGEAADAQGVIEADGLYKYVYHHTLQYIDKTNQQLRLINQQKRGRGETYLHLEYPLQTPKRIVEGIGEVVLGVRWQSALPDTIAHPRQALVVEGLGNTPAAISLSKLLRNAGNFELEYHPQPGKDWSEVRAAIQACLRAADASPVDATTTALLYLRGWIEETSEGESWLVLGDGLRLSRSWLRHELRHATMTQQIVILDCPTATSLADWIEDLQLGADTPTGTGLDRGQCLIAAASPAAQPDLLIQMLLQTLAATDAQVVLPVAGWIARLQVALAGTGVPLHLWLSGARGVIEVLPGLGAQGTLTGELDLGMCPYMGLRAFSENDAPFFYGREALTQTLLQQFSQHSCLAIVGASGSGKSSVVQAGLMAQLRQGKQLPGSDRWWIGCFRPGERPLQALAQRLVDSGSEKEKTYQQQQIEGLLYQGVDGFVHWLRQRSEPMVLLVVDQFEELFTLASEQERQQFLDLILGAIEYASDRFKLVLTLRADFVAAGLEVPQLATVLQRSSVLVPPSLTEDDYRQVMMRPAEQVGLRVEPELVEVLLEELNHSAGDLPLLEFVLEQLWERRQNGALTLQAYQQELGGLKIALERKAQEVYDSLDPEAQACAQWIFLTLTQLGEMTEDTRRRVHKSDLVVAKYPEPLVDRTLQALITAKLIVVGLEDENTTGQSRGDSSPTRNSLPLTPYSIEVAHEILIRHWSTLRWWLEENRARLRAQRQVMGSALLWQQHDRQPDFLLRGVRLAEAEDLYIKYTDELPQYVQQFIEACLEERQREQLQAKRRLRWAQTVATVIGGLGVMATGLAGLAYWQQRTAQLREVEALAASSEALLASNRQLESLVTSTKAAHQLQQLRSPFGIPLGVPINTELKTAGALQQALQTQEFNRLEGHTNQVNVVRSSPDGQTIATAGDDRVVKLWGRDGTWRKDLAGHGDRVTQSAFSQDGKLLATASADKTVKLWSSDGTLITTISGHQDWVTAVSFSPDSQFVATASRDQTIKLWQITPESNSSIRLLKTLVGHKGWVNSIDFSPDGEWIASGGEDGTIKIWRIDDARNSPLRSFPGAAERITALKFSPDGRTIAAASGDRTVKFWSWSGDLLQTFVGHLEQVNSLDFGPDGMLVTAGADKTVKLWHLDGTVQQTLSGHGAEINSVMVSADGTIASASADKTVRLWRANSFSQPHGNTYTADFSPNGQLYAVAGWNQTIQIWQLEDQSAAKLVRTLKGHQAPVSAISFSPDGQWLASASADKTARLWRVVDGAPIRAFTGHRDGVTAVGFSPDSQVLVTGSVDKTIRLWQVENGKFIRSLTGHTDQVASVSFSPDGQTIASGSYDNTIRLWRNDGTPITTLGQHGLAISALSFSADGNTLASGSWDNTIKLWNLDDHSLIKTLSGPNESITSLDFAPGGASQTMRHILVSGSTDSTIQLWDTVSGVLLKTLTAPAQTGQPDQLHSVRFSPDGRALISASDRSGAKLWNLDLNNLLQQSCSRLHDYLQRVARSQNSEQTPDVPPRHDSAYCPAKSSF